MKKKYCHHSFVMIFVLLLLSFLLAAAFPFSGTADSPEPTDGMHHNLLIDPSFTTGDRKYISLVGHIGGAANDVAVAGNYAYVTSSEAGLRAIYVADPSTPTAVGFYKPQGRAKGVAVAGNFAYIISVNNDMLSTTDIIILDISDPSAPIKIGSFTTKIWFGHDVAVAGDYAYVVGENGLHIINVADPTAPTGAGDLYLSGTVQGVAVSGNYAYLANVKLHIIDISNPAEPAEIGSYHTPLSYILDMDVEGNNAYLADANRGLVIIDVSIPAAPKEIGKHGFYAGDVVVSGNYAYVSAYGLRVIDISNPVVPSEIGNYNEAGCCGQLDVDSNYIYVAASENGLNIFQCTSGHVIHLPMVQAR